MLHCLTPLRVGVELKIVTSPTAGRHGYGCGCARARGLVEASGASKVRLAIMERGHGVNELCASDRTALVQDRRIVLTSHILL